MYNNELYHHGRLGQKWGVKNGPPYPLTGRGLSAYRQRRKAKKAEKLAKKQEQAETEEEKAERREADKKRALKEGKATDLLPYMHELSTNEIQNALNRIQWEEKLLDQAFKESESEQGWASINAVMKKVGDVKDWTSTGVALWKNIDDAIKLLSGEGDKVHPSGGGGKKKKK